MTQVTFYKNALLYQLPDSICVSVLVWVLLDGCLPWNPCSVKEGLDVVLALVILAPHESDT